MNPFQTAYARSETAAAGAKVDPRLVHLLAGTATAAQLTPATAGAIDLVAGDTNALNSGELPLNLLIAAFASSGVGGGGIMASNAINDLIDKREKSADTPRAAENISARDPKIKAEMMRIHKEQGADAASAYFAGLKDKEAARVNAPVNGRFTQAGSLKRRMAGQAAAALLGAGVSIPLLIDDQY